MSQGSRVRFPLGALFALNYSLKFNSAFFKFFILIMEEIKEINTITSTSVHKPAPKVLESFSSKENKGF